jgi:2-polyprenyl-3-methyl-5-hydroxy-6-metoxy-1,4-benzoquinol methylase
LDDLSTAEKEPIESALYKNSPEMYDLLYRRFSKNLSDFLKLVTQHTPAGGFILDMAAGTGEVTIPLLQAGYQVLSADLNPGMLQQLEEKAKQKMLVSTTLVANFSNFNRNKQFDAITVRQAINYLIGVDNLVRGLINLRKALKPGGKLIFNTPNFNPKKFSLPTSGPTKIKLGIKNAIVWESNRISEDQILEHHQKALVWDDENPELVHYYHDLNTFMMYTKDQVEHALKNAGFPEVVCLSSHGKPYDPNDPVLYVIATAPLASNMEVRAGIIQIHENDSHAIRVSE